MLMLGVGLAALNGLRIGGSVPPEPLPPGAPVPVGVNADGWTAEARIAGVPSPGTWGTRRVFDPNAADTGLTVRRPGWNAAGTAVTVSDAVAMTTEIRVPFGASFANAGAYALQRTADGADARSRVALAEFVHAGDVVDGVANGSTKPYPKPQFAWLSPDFQAFDTNSVTLRAVAGHWFARQGRPVAAVRFIVSDAVTSAEVVVGTTTPTGFSASGLFAPAFVGTLDISGLANGQLTLDAIVYPWAGPAFRLSTDGIARPGLTCNTHIAYKNVLGEAGYIPPVYCYMSPTGTATATGPGASADPATAALPANRFSSTQNALTNAELVHTAAGRANTLSYTILRFASGTYPSGLPFDDRFSNPANFATGTAPLFFEAEVASEKDTVILQDRPYGATGQPTVPPINMPARAVFRNLTIQKVVNTANGGNNRTYGPRGYTSTNSALVFDNVRFDRSGQPANPDPGTWMQTGGRTYLINCSAPGGGWGFSNGFATNAKNVMLIGCGTGLTGNCVISLIASRATSYAVQEVGAGRTIPYTGAVCAFNFFSNNPGGRIIAMSGAALAGNDYGLLFAGNVVERFGGSDAAMWTWADGNNEEVRNLNVMMNTIPGRGDGHRWNRLYNDAGANAAAKEGTHRMNVVSRSSAKTDTFVSPSGGQNAARIGNWPAAFHVASAYSTFIEGDTAPNAELGPLSWRRQCDFRGMQWGDGAGGVLNPLWTDDATLSGTATGGGNYTPQAGSPLRRVPGAFVPYSHDLFGRAVPLDGTAFVGAVQRGV